MTTAERFQAAARGEAVDRKPVLAWPVASADADIDVRPAHGFTSEGRPALAHLTNLYGAIRPHSALSPSEIGGLLEEGLRSCIEIAKSAVRAGALGLLYEIRGATLGESTPMEYGGLYLERDREMLETVRSLGANVLFVSGAEPYLDFVADLPAHVFAWDLAASGMSVAEVRAVRNGPLAADDPEADVLLIGGRNGAALEDRHSLNYA